MRRKKNKKINHKVNLSIISTPVLKLSVNLDNL